MFCSGEGWSRGFKVKVKIWLKICVGVRIVSGQGESYAGWVRTWISVVFTAAQMGVRVSVRWWWGRGKGPGFL